jgi:hypothetical protein
LRDLGLCQVFFGQVRRPLAGKLRALGLSGNRVDSSNQVYGSVTRQRYTGQQAFFSLRTIE